MGRPHCQQDLHGLPGQRMRVSAAGFVTLGKPENLAEPWLSHLPNGV